MNVLAVIGPTASGKSAVALEAAEARHRSGRPTEIVAVDAFTVYRGMDIATAKSSVVDRQRVTHHLVDVLDPSDPLTVAQFQRLARAAIGEIFQRGATPLLVGGSGLYWRAVVDDLEFPPTDRTLRASIEAQWSHDVAAAHAHLRTRDPAAAAAIAAGNLRRIVRALEVIELTGNRFSAYRTAYDCFDSIYQDLDVTLIDPGNDELKAAISARARAMVASGLIEEAEQLRRQPLSSTAQAAIGYAEAIAVLDGRLARTELAEAITARTWRYARRQRSWFRKDPRPVLRAPDAAVAHLSRQG